MHIHIHRFRRHIQEQRQQRVAVMRQEILIGSAHRAQQQPVLHWSAIDEQELHLRIAAIERRQPGIAGQVQPLAAGIDGHRILGEGIAHDRGQPPQPYVEQLALSGGQLHGAARAIAQREADMRVRHRETVQHIDRLAIFGARRLQEFQPCRCGVEQVAHLDPGARRMGGGLDG